MERVDGVVVAADALGHTFGVRVQRGRLTGLRPEGCGRLMAAGCVEGLHRFAQGAEKKVLKMDGPSAQGFLSLTALRAEGCGLPLRAMLIKSALRDLPFCVIGLDWHFGD